MSQGSELNLVESMNGIKKEIAQTASYVKLPKHHTGVFLMITLNEELHNTSQSIENNFFFHI